MERCDELTYDAVNLISESCSPFTRMHIRGCDLYPNGIVETIDTLQWATAAYILALAYVRTRSKPLRAIHVHACVLLAHKYLLDDTVSTKEYASKHGIDLRVLGLTEYRVFAELGCFIRMDALEMDIVAKKLIAILLSKPLLSPSQSITDSNTMEQIGDENDLSDV